MVSFVVNTRHKPARAPQIPTTLILCTSSAHRYQNKGVTNRKSQFLSPLFSHACAHLRLYPLCFDMLHKNTRGGVVAPSPTVRSRIGSSGGANPKREERFLAAQTSLGMTGSEGGRNPRTGLKTGRYINRERSGPPQKDGPYMRRREAGTIPTGTGTMYRAPTRTEGHASARFSNFHFPVSHFAGLRWTLGTGHLPLALSVMLSGGPLHYPACPDPRGELRGAALLLQRPAQNLGERYFRP